MKALAVVDDPLFSEHRAQSAHPERPERLDAARAALDRADLGLPKVRLSARDASPDELGRVHDPGYLERLGRSAGSWGHLDPDTFFAPSSAAASVRAAGGALAMVDALLGGAASFGVALLRPPGHHARPGAAMGFCLLNNVAVAAAHARAQGSDRVLILDWDVHHGNGTQEMFFDDPSVLYVSLHQYPFYPGTGAADEVGRGEGRGFTVNIPLCAGANDAVYLAAFDRIVAPIAEQFDPDLVLVSAGFDAHRRDPLAAMELDETAYGAMLERLSRALPRGTEGRLGLVLEGGYDLRALSASLGATLAALVRDHDGPSAASPPSISARHQAELDRAQTEQNRHWKLG